MLYSSVRNEGLMQKVAEYVEPTIDDVKSFGRNVHSYVENIHRGDYRNLFTNEDGELSSKDSFIGNVLASLDRNDLVRGAAPYALLGAGLGGISGALGDDDGKKKKGGRVRRTLRGLLAGAALGGLGGVAGGLYNRGTGALENSDLS